MRSENKRIIRLIVGYSVLILLLAWLMPPELNWTPSFSKEKTWPYGSKILFEQLGQIFPGENVIVTDRPIYNTLSDSSSANYISISDRFTADPLDIEELLDFVSKGNQVFLSSQSFSQDLMDTLNLELMYEFKTDDVSGLPSEAAQFTLNFTNSEHLPKNDYFLKSTRFYHHFESLYDSIDIQALGMIEEDKICFTRVVFGEGTFYLHSFPYAFTNYHMLDEKNISYVASCFSYLPRAAVIWDEYYKLDRRNRQESPMKTILEARSFKWAYWLGIISLLAFMMFMVKRRQAPIPVLEPYKNESLKFTKTIGDLYFEKASNRDIALKKISVLKDYIRRKFMIEDIRFRTEEIDLISKKSGHDRDELLKLWEDIRVIRETKLITNNQLKSLGQSLYRFYGRNKIRK